MQQGATSPLHPLLHLHLSRGTGSMQEWRLLLHPVLCIPFSRTIKPLHSKRLLSLWEGLLSRCGTASSAYLRHQICIFPSPLVAEITRTQWKGQANSPQHRVERAGLLLQDTLWRESVADSSGWAVRGSPPFLKVDDPSPDRLNMIKGYILFTVEHTVMNCLINHGSAKTKS